MHGGLDGPTVLGPDDAQRYMTAIEIVSNRLGAERFEELAAAGSRLSIHELAERTTESITHLLDTDTPRDHND